MFKNALGPIGMHIYVTDRFDFELKDLVVALSYIPCSVRTSDLRSYNTEWNVFLNIE